MTEPRTPRSRFYDGSIYAGVMDRFLTGLHGFVAGQIAAGERVLDAGCGTGRLAFELAPVAREVVGVELSPAMIDYANRRRAREGLDNVSFRLGDLTQVLADEPDHAFDVATLVMALHEMPSEARHPVLRELARVARRILCVDFRAAMPRNLTGLRNRMLELVAGPEHFQAFRDFRRRGGVPGIASDSGLSCKVLRSLDGATLELCDVRRAG